MHQGTLHYNRGYSSCLLKHNTHHNAFVSAFRCQWKQFLLAPAECRLEPLQALLQCGCARRVDVLGLWCLPWQPAILEYSVATCSGRAFIVYVSCVALLSELSFLSCFLAAISRRPISSLSNAKELNKFNKIITRRVSNYVNKKTLTRLASPAVQTSQQFPLFLPSWYRLIDAAKTPLVF